MANFPELLTCTNQPPCERQLFVAPPCGSVIGHLPPAPLSEGICYNALRGQLYLADAAKPYEGQARDQAWIDFRRASARLDLVMHPDTASKQADTYFDEIPGYLRRVIDNEAVDEQLKIDSYCFLKQLVLFEDQDDSGPSPDALKKSTKNLANLALNLEDLVTSETVFPAAQGRLLLPLLLARSDIGAYPATFREDCLRWTLNSKYQRDAHKMYSVIDGQKIPINYYMGQTTKRKYRQGINIGMRQIIGDVLIGQGLSSEEQAPLERSAAVITWLCTDILEPEEIAPNISAALDTLSNTVAGQVKAKSKDGERP